MTRYIIRRVLVVLPLMLAVVIIIFVMVRFIPGDPAQMMGGEYATEKQLELIRARLGLDKSVVTQFFIFMGNLFQGDMGNSIRNEIPVATLIGYRLPNSLLLAATAMFFACLLGFPAGIIAAVKQNSVYDYSATISVLALLAIPRFWLGLMLMLVFSVMLGWFPTTGSGSLRHLILPAITLGGAVTASIARMTRSSMLEVMHLDYIRTARAKGLTGRVVILRHALKNALIPVVTVIGITAGGLICAGVVVEVVFAWPGVGRLLIESILSRDYPVVQGAVLVYAFIVILSNLVVDISYAYIDPRIHY